MKSVRSVPKATPSEGTENAALDFDVIYRAHAQRVSVWVRRLLGSPPDVEDVVHDVFSVALRRRADYDASRGEYGAWLHGITVRTVIAHRRRQHIHRLWRGLFAREQMLQNDAGSEGSPDEAVDVNRVRRRLYGWLETLPESQRTVFILFEIDEMDGPAIAALLNISVNNVWVRLHRARAALEMLAKKAGFHSEVTHAKR